MDSSTITVRAASARQVYDVASALGVRVKGTIFTDEHGEYAYLVATRRFGDFRLEVEWSSDPGRDAELCEFRDTPTGARGF